jgi:hypothetical protein
MSEQIDWKPYLDRVNVILKGKNQPELTQNEAQNVVNNWQRAFRGPIAEFIVQLPPFASKPLMEQLKRDMANIIYDVLKASRGGGYK